MKYCYYTSDFFTTGRWYSLKTVATNKYNNVVESGDKRLQPFIKLDDLEDNLTCDLVHDQQWFVI